MSTRNLSGGIGAADIACRYQEALSGIFPELRTEFVGPNLLALSFKIITKFILSFLNCELYFTSNCVADQSSNIL